MRGSFGALLAVLAAACGGDGSGPSTVNVSGTFSGDYTASITPGVTYQGVLQLTQNGNQVSGTLTTSAGGSATVSGTVSGSRVTGTWTFSAGCTGTASSTANVSNNGRRLSGSYSANDCNGQYSGSYVLNKQ